VEFRQLGNTDIRVSVLCLGTMTWGEQNTEQDAFAQLDSATAVGVNFIDAAEMYPVPPRQDTYGQTELILGRWLRSRGGRERYVIATKVAGRADWLPYVRDGRPCLDRRNITAALDASLRRLQTDYVDLYQLHWPDRSTNFFGKLGYLPAQKEIAVSIQESLTVLAELVSEGKIRHIGISNETPWGAMTFLRLAEKFGLPRIVSIQNPYNLLNRTFEVGLAEIAHREQMGLLAYSPLGFGVLSGKYLGNARPAGARLTLFDRFKRYTNRQSETAVEAYVAIARRHGLDPAQMALAFVSRQPFLTSTIIGATNLAQLASDLQSAELTLPESVIADIEAVHVQYPNPAP
jgi:aryl-alcohol dehydrogenase-like predicted oxidoreductase